MGRASFMPASKAFGLFSRDGRDLVRKGKQRNGFSKQQPKDQTATAGRWFGPLHPLDAGGFVTHWAYGSGAAGCGAEMKLLIRRRFGLETKSLSFCDMGYGSKSNHQGTAGFSPCFHLPGFHFGHTFLSNCWTKWNVEF